MTKAKQNIEKYIVVINRGELSTKDRDEVKKTPDL